MIRIIDTPKPRDRFGSIPIRDGKPMNSSLHGLHLPRRPKRSFLWTWLRRSVGLLLGLLLLLGLGSPLLAPYLTTTFLARHMAATLNRSVTIARAEFNPLTCTLTLHQLIVGPKLSTPDDPVDPLLSAGSISLALAPKRLLDGALACNLNTEHFFLHLVREKDGTYNLDQVIDALLSTMPVLPLQFSWDTIAVRNSRLVFDDGQTGRTHQAEELALTISPPQSSPLRLQAKINGTPVILPNPADLTASPAQPPNPLPAKPEPAESEGDANTAPDTPDNPAVKTAEAIALVQELTQAARQYRHTTITPSTESRLLPPLAP